LQVDLAPPPIDERKHLTGKNVPGSVKIEGELDNISAHWPATTLPNPQPLRIIVELPSGVSCFPSYVNPRSFLRRGVFDQPPPKRRRLYDSGDPEIPRVTENHTEELAKELEDLRRRLRE
jgi:hypothetical protein